MVVLANKDLNISYQIGKKRQLNDSLNCLVDENENPNATSALFSFLKRTKNTSEQNKEEKVSFEEQSENELNQTYDCVFLSLSNINEDREYEFEYRSKELENTCDFGNEISDESDAVIISNPRSQHLQSGILNPLAITSTPKKNSAEICTFEADDIENDLKTHPFLRINPYSQALFEKQSLCYSFFGKNGVYLNETKELTPYTMDIISKYRTLAAAMYESGVEPEDLSTDFVHPS